jgi:hypothetical protein
METPTILKHPLFRLLPAGPPSVPNDGARLPSLGRILYLPLNKVRHRPAGALNLLFRKPEKAWLC